MYSVEVDQSKRVVVLSVVKHVTAEETRDASRQLREKLENVAPGFDVLVDFRWLDSMEAASAKYIGEIMDTLSQKHVRSITRVIPDPHKDIGLNILSHFHYGPEIEIATFESFADAIQSLCARGAGGSASEDPSK